LAKNFLLLFILSLPAWHGLPAFAGNSKNWDDSFSEYESDYSFESPINEFRDLLNYHMNKLMSSDEPTHIWEDCVVFSLLLEDKRTTDLVLDVFVNALAKTDHENDFQKRSEKERKLLHVLGQSISGVSHQLSYEQVYPILQTLFTYIDATILERDLFNSHNRISEKNKNWLEFVMDLFPRILVKMDDILFDDSHLTDVEKTTQLIYQFLQHKNGMKIIKDTHVLEAISLVISPKTRNYYKTRNSEVQRRRASILGHLLQESVEIQSSSLLHNYFSEAHLFSVYKF